MRKFLIITAGVSLLLAALACGPATQSGGPGPTMDSAPRPTDTAAPPAEATMPPAPTQDGSGAGGTPISPEGGPGTLEDFRQALLDNINSRNYQFLFYTMNDPFTIGGWRAGAGELSAQDARQKLQDELLPPDNVVHYDLDKDITALLDGTPPEQEFGPDVKIVDAIFENGWGPDGKGEVILFISQTPEGVFTWYGIVYASQGFK